MRVCFIFSLMALFVGCSLQPNLLGSKGVTTVVPDESGNSKDFISWTDFQYRVSKGRLEGKVVFKPGVYQIVKAINVKGEGPLNMLAEEGVRFIGNFDFAQPSKATSGFVLHRGDIQFDGFDFSSVGSCISVAKQSEVRRVAINNLKARNVHSCIVVDRHIDSTVSNWQLSDISVKGYYRVAIRFAGGNTSAISLNRFYADGFHDYSANHCYKGGLQILKGAFNISVKDAHILNNVGDCGQSYQQGDGVEADHKGGRTRDLIFEDIRVENSGDANFDLKAEGVVLKNIQSVAGSMTRYAYKFWAYPDYYCQDCNAIGPFSAYLNLISASVMLENFSFEGLNSGNFINCQNKPSQPRSYLTLNDGIVAGVSEVNVKETLGLCGAEYKVGKVVFYPSK